MHGPILQIGQIVFDLLRAQLPEPRTNSTLHALVTQKAVFGGTYYPCATISKELSQMILQGNTYFNSLPIHLAFYCLLQSEEGNVNGVLELQTFRVPLFKESLCARCTLSDRSCFP